MKTSPSWLGSSLSQPTRRYRKSHRAQVPYSYQGQPRPKGDTSLPGSISSCSAANQLESKRSEACPYFKRKQKDVAAAPSLFKNLKIWSYKVHTGGTQQTRFEEGVGEGRQRLSCCHALNESSRSGHSWENGTFPGTSQQGRNASQVTICILGSRYHL